MLISISELGKAYLHLLSKKGSSNEKIRIQIAVSASNQSIYQIRQFNQGALCSASNLYT